jgi:hypothetical protein
VTEAFTRRLGPVEYESEPVAQAERLVEGDNPGQGVLRAAAFESIHPVEKFPALLGAEPADADRSDATILAGIITMENVVIYFGESKPRRIPLGNGVYAELQLCFDKDAMETLPWTYEAFVSSELQDFCRRVRENLPR